jgi:ABC-type glycerol-3-phosphate transport system substrate-binding protein
MRKLSAVLLAVGLVISVAAVAEQLPAPKTEAIFPGVTKVLYAGETFVFTTTVKLSAKFEAAYPDRIQIKVKTSATLRDGMALAPGDMVRIYWEDGDETLYNGMPPENEWIGMVLTEGGLTEK